jgi:hypothetical protein
MRRVFKVQVLTKELEMTVFAYPSLTHWTSDMPYTGLRIWAFSRNLTTALGEGVQYQKFGMNSAIDPALSQFTGKTTSYAADT